MAWEQKALSAYPLSMSVYESATEQQAPLSIENVVKGLMDVVHD